MNFVPDPLHIEREVGRCLECQPPREKGDHVVWLSECHDGVGSPTLLSCCGRGHFLHDFVRDVKIRVNLLHVIMLVQDLH